MAVPPHLCSLMTMAMMEAAGLPLNYILWDVDPVMARLGSLELRWYGLLFAMAFILGQFFILKMWRGEGKPEKDVETLTLYAMVATVVGARLGHCLFYQPEVYLAHPLEILKIWEGGLASHGAAFGIILSMYFYSRGRPGQSMLWTLDRVVIVVALGGFCIRMGNLANSEIVGKPADLPWSFVFAHAGHEAIASGGGQVVAGVSFHKTGEHAMVENGDPLVHLRTDLAPGPAGNLATLTGFATRQLPELLLASDEAHEHFRPEFSPLNPQMGPGGRGLSVTLAAVPRHPSQVYEAIGMLILFIVLYRAWMRYKQRIPEGLFFGIFLIYCFGLRFFYEFFKENQVAFEDHLTLNMGQSLSIPLVLAGVGVIYYALNRKRDSGATMA